MHYHWTADISNIRKLSKVPDTSTKGMLSFIFEEEVSTCALPYRLTATLLAFSIKEVIVFSILNQEKLHQDLKIITINISKGKKIKKPVYSQLITAYCYFLIWQDWIPKTVLRIYTVISPRTEHSDLELHGNRFKPCHISCSHLPEVWLPEAALLYLSISWLPS